MNEQEMEMLSEGRYSELVEVLKKKLEINSENSETKFDLAVAYSHNGNRQQAVQLYEDILAQNKDTVETVEVLVNVGILYHYEGDSQKALEIYRKAIRLAREKIVDPQCLALAYINIGVVFSALVQYERSVIAYKQALALNPHSQMALEYLENLQEYGDTDHGLLRVRVLLDGQRITEYWYYQDFDIGQINVDEVLGI